MLFYYLRHGDPIYTPDGLTEKGKMQADALAKRLARVQFDEIYSSDSNRALLTAKPTCDALHKKPILLPWANEGLAWQEFTKVVDDRRYWLFLLSEAKKEFVSEEMFALGDQWATHPVFDGTKAREGKERIDRETDAFFESLGYRHDRKNRCYEPIAPNEKKIAMFAHQGFGMVFLSSLLDIPYPEFSARFDLSHSSMTVIDFCLCGDVVIPKALQVSSDSHLYKEGLPTLYNNVIEI